jgi:hypothetical protein
MNDELEIIWKEAVTRNWGISGNLPAGPKETTKDFLLEP